MAMGPEGFEPPPPGLKGRCAAVTPRPRCSNTAGPAFPSLDHRSHLLHHPNDKGPRIRAAGFEPAISSSPSLRIGQAFPRPGRGRPGSGMAGVKRSARTLVERAAAPQKQEARGHRDAGPRESTRGIGTGQTSTAMNRRRIETLEAAMGPPWLPYPSQWLLTIAVHGPILLPEAPGRPGQPSSSCSVQERRRGRPRCSRRFRFFSRPDQSRISMRER